MSTTTIINPKNLDTTKICYSAPEINSIPGQKMTFKRIRMNYEINNDLKDFVIESPANLLSWGLTETRDLQTSALTGYQMAINLWSKPNKTSEEEQFIQAIDKIVDHVKEHLVNHRDSIERYDLELADLKKLNPLYYKMEKGQRVPDRGPTLYAKTMYSKKDNNILTCFVDESLESRIDPMDILNKHCYVKFSLKVESIFIGTSISLQLKLKEVHFRLKDGGVRDLRSQLNPNISIANINKEAYTSLAQTTKTNPTELITTENDGEESEVEYEEYEEEEEIVIKEEVITPTPTVKIEEKVIVDVPPVQKKKNTRTKKLTA